jgi:hypothetical protein
VRLRFKLYKGNHGTVDQSDLHKRFVKVLGSEAEKCLQYVIPTIHGRMKPSDPKSEKFTEPSEEVRLRLISLLRDLIACCGKKMVDYLDELHGILEMAYTDFHEMKKVSQIIGY